MVSQKLCRPINIRPTLSWKNLFKNLHVYQELGNYTCTLRVTIRSQPAASLTYPFLWGEFPSRIRHLCLPWPYISIFPLRKQYLFFSVGFWVLNSPFIVIRLCVPTPS